MAYRKLGRVSKHRKSMLANLTMDLINNESIVTTETRAKEVRKFLDKMVTYGKDGSLVSRRKAMAFLHNDDKTTKKVFEDLGNFLFFCCLFDSFCNKIKIEGKDNCAKRKYVSYTIYNTRRLSKI